MLSTYFPKSWNTLVPPLSCSQDQHFSELDYTFLDDLTCTEEEVHHLLKTLNSSKAAGPDRISVRMLKETASAMPSLTDLFNNSIYQGCFPACWKIANVVPVPKKSSPCGYRPISLLSIISKIIEKHVYSIIYDYLLEHYPIACNQWGFQSGKSCTTASVTTTYDWYNGMENGKDVVTVFFDFQKAFDSVPHGPLNTKLQNTGLHPHIVKWVQSYLTNRTQRVVVNGSESVSVDVSGVPQGSVLGPLLFLVYVSNITLSKGSKLAMYVDDLVLYKVIDVEAAFLLLQEDINNIVQWTESNHMNLNKSKCKVMLLFRKCHNLPPMFIDQHDQIEQVSTYSRSILA